MEPQIVEVLGRNHLITELTRAGIEVAIPERDRGIDLIAYLDLPEKYNKFISVPIQMKAASKEVFSYNDKYEKFPNMLVVFVWNLNREDKTISYALTHREILKVAKEMDWDKTASWKAGNYTTTKPSKKLLKLLSKYIMDAKKWYDKIIQVSKNI